METPFIGGALNDLILFQPLGWAVAVAVLAPQKLTVVVDPAVRFLAAITTAHVAVIDVRPTTTIVR